MSCERCEQAEAELARLTKEFEHYKTVVAPASRLAVMADCPNCKALEQQRNEWEQRWQQAEAHISKMSDVFLRLGKAVNLADKVVESLHEVPALVESLKQAEAGLVHKDESVALADRAVERLKQELSRVTAELDDTEQARDANGEVADKLEQHNTRLREALPLLWEAEQKTRQNCEWCKGSTVICGNTPECWNCKVRKAQQALDEAREE